MGAKETIRRLGDGTPKGESHLEIRLTGDGDLYISVKGLSPTGQPSEAQVEFTAPFGGGWHPETRRVILRLMEAIRKDNSNPKNPSRYQENNKKTGL